MLSFTGRKKAQSVRDTAVPWVLAKGPVHLPLVRGNILSSVGQFVSPAFTGLHLIFLLWNKHLKTRRSPQVTSPEWVCVSEHCLPLAFPQLLRSTFIFQATLIQMTRMRFFIVWVTMVRRCHKHPGLLSALGWHSPCPCCSSQ